MSETPVQSPMNQEAFDQEFFGIVDYDELNQAAINQVMALQQFDVLTNTEDPNMLNAMNEYNLSVEELSYDGLVEAIERRKQEDIAVAAQEDRQRMDTQIHVLDVFTGNSSKSLRKKKKTLVGA